MRYLKTVSEFLKESVDSIPYAHFMTGDKHKTGGIENKFGVDVTSNKFEDEEDQELGETLDKTEDNGDEK